MLIPFVVKIIPGPMSNGHLSLDLIAVGMTLFRCELLCSIAHQQSTTKGWIRTCFSWDDVSVLVWAFYLNKAKWNRLSAVINRSIWGRCYQEAMGMNSLKMQTLSCCKRRIKVYGRANISVPFIVQPMEICVHSRLILARYKGCTNAKCVLSRSYGHEEFKNVNHFSVKKAHKAVRSGQYLRPLHRSIVTSMEIPVHSRLILARYKGCTNARCILSRSYGHEEFKNANSFSVQKAHKAVRSGQYLRPLHCSIVTSMEIRVHSRLILARYKGCTNARCILSRSYA